MANARSAPSLAPMGLAPPTTAPEALGPQLAAHGYAVLRARDLAHLVAHASASGAPSDGPAPASGDQLGDVALRLERWSAWWEGLPPDRYLKDGGRYRRRRHGCFIAQAGRGVEPVPPRAHWQPLEYNALHGGIERWFEPLPQPLVDDPAWPRLLGGLAAVAGRIHPSYDGAWFIEAHQFRIDTTDGIGRPTPEGAHRDGVDLVAVLLVDRRGIKGGETRVFEARGPQGLRFTLTESWSVLLLDDARVVHETTPIQPLTPGAEGSRDTLVLTFRRGGFQGP